MTHIDTEHTHSHMTSLAISQDIWQEALTRSFWTFLSRAVFAPWILFPESVSPNPKRQSFASPYSVSLFPTLLLLLHAFYFMALSVNCRRIGNSTGSPACCAPPGDELLLSRASRSRGLTLCGLSSRGSGLEKPK